MQLKISTIDNIFCENYAKCVKVKETNLISVIEAAEKLGVSRWRVNQFINEGRLPATKIGRSYVIKEKDLELVRDRKVGRPVKKDES